MLPKTARSPPEGNILPKEAWPAVQDDGVFRKNAGSDVRAVTIAGKWISSEILGKEIAATRQAKLSSKSGISDEIVLRADVAQTMASTDEIDDELPRLIAAIAG